MRLAHHQRSSRGNRDGESSAPAAFVYVAEVTRERRNRSAGTHTRSPPDPFRAPAHHAPGNEHTSRPVADRTDVAPRAERCVCLPLRNDAVRSQARSRRCSFHSARNRRQGLNASSQRRHALAFVQDVCSPQGRTIAHGRRLMSDSIQMSVWESHLRWCLRGLGRYKRSCRQVWRRFVTHPAPGAELRFLLVSSRATAGGANYHMRQLRQPDSALHRHRTPTASAERQDQSHQKPAS